jgi:hypothetical protein
MLVADSVLKVFKRSDLILSNLSTEVPEALQLSELKRHPLAIAARKQHAVSACYWA